MLNAAYGMLAMLPVAFWVGRARDGVATTAGSPSPIAESEIRTIDLDARGRRAASGKLATMAKRLRAKTGAKTLCA